MQKDNYNFTTELTILPTSKLQCLSFTISFTKKKIPPAGYTLRPFEESEGKYGKGKEEFF